MNINTILLLFLGLCRAKIGNATPHSECRATVSAFPPDAKTGCCGNDLSGSKLIGGPATAIDQYPWLALIEYIRPEDGKIKTFCGGALISAKYVLTTAHCVRNQKVRNFLLTNIRLGEYNKDNDGPDCVSDMNSDKECTDGETRIPIEKVIPHPEYKKEQKRNDIALIRMKETAPFTDFIRPICLPSTDVTVEKGVFNFYLGSWTTPDGPSPVKVHVNLPFVTQDECKSLHTFYNLTLWKGQLCAGGETGKDSCKGDGGMPLMYENRGSFEIIGIVSFGPKRCGQENRPSVYTNVYEYKSWITSNIVP